MALAMSRDDLLATFVPIAVYWIYSGIYMIFENFHDYRMHRMAEEEAKNVVPKRTVVKGVLLQQIIQISVAFLVLTVTKKYNIGNVQRAQPALHVIILQIFVGMVVMDTWQYFAHRLMHINKFLYKHVHSQHHELVAPYCFGALYSHPIEVLIIDTGGAIIAFLVSGMSPLTSAFFLSFAAIKTIDDHSGLWLPVNLLRYLFKPTSAYHPIHHQPYGIKYNFSNPFFVTWDKLLGTYMTYTLKERKDGGGVVVRPLLKKIVD